VGEAFRKKLDGDVASELRVGRLIDVSHTARTEMAGDFVMRELCSNHWSIENAARILAEAAGIAQEIGVRGAGVTGSDPGCTEGFDFRRLRDSATVTPRAVRSIE